MRDRVTEICEREFDRMVQAEREAACSFRHSKMVPHIGGVYLESEHAELMQQVARALAFQERHKQTGPSWAQPLPLKMEECEILLNNSHNSWKLLGYFGRSLRWSHWHEQHPDFSTFCSGVLDFFLCPPEIKMDPDLLRLFPPKPLAEITNPLHWRGPTT